MFIVSSRVVTPFLISERVVVRRIGFVTPWKALNYIAFLLLLPFRLPRRSIFMATFFVTYYSVRLAAAIRRRPYLYFVQDIESKYMGLRGTVLNALCNLTYRDQHILAANSYLRETLRQRFHCNSRSIDIGPSEIFYYRPVRVPKRFNVIYFLREEQWKGLDRFQRLLAISGGRLTFLCVSQNEKLFNAVVDPAVTCCKPQGDDELIDCIDSSEVLLSTSYREGFSLPPLEAMARGVPPVLFRCGGPDVYVQAGVNAIYVENETQVVEETAALLRNPEQYALMRRAAVSTAERFRLKRGLLQATELITEYSRGH